MLLILLSVSATISNARYNIDFLLFAEYCLLPQYLLCLLPMFFIISPLKIYENGIDLPVSFFKKIILRNHIYVAYNELESIFPTYYDVALGPGASDWGPGKTSLMGIKLEFKNGKSFLIKFQHSILSDPLHANIECDKAMNVLRTHFRNNDWRLVNNPFLPPGERKNKYGEKKVGIGLKGKYFEYLLLMIPISLLIVIFIIILSFDRLSPTTTGLVIISIFIIATLIILMILQFKQNELIARRDLNMKIKEYNLEKGLFR